MLCKELASAADYLDVLCEQSDEDVPAEFGEIGVKCDHHTVILPKLGGGYVCLKLLKISRADGQTWRSCIIPIDVEILDSFPA